jgi:hypothetical protein
MYNKTMGSYDEIPEGMKSYINNYGCHFNKKLCEEAARNMYKKVNGKEVDWILEDDIQVSTNDTLVVQTRESNKKEFFSPKYVK